MKNLKEKLVVTALTVAATAPALAGDIADAITNNAAVTSGQADLYTVGGVVAGFVIVGVIFGAAFRLFKKAG